ncbi:MAG TPA: PAS domain S-box protein [Candidatus Acidoferrales bacterium]|jgi:PAS domain S-box-containing protein|nr:PAS domain S-box protein [Candidatus Acidoferrales bacterium]
MTIATEERSAVPKLPLSVLLVEDNSNDAELCLRALERPEFEICLDIVKTPEDFRSRVRGTSYDIILADYDLGSWTGLDALNLLREEGGDSPFILVTGALGEQRAVECIKSGISDYVLKDHLERLPVAMLRALEEKGQRAEQQCEERSLHVSEAKFRALAEAIPAAVFIEQGTRSCYVNHAAECITGYTREELLTMNFWQLLLPRSRDEVLQRAIRRFNGDDSPCRYEIQILTKKKEVRHLDVTVGLFGLDGSLAALITAFDITHLHSGPLHQSATAGN